MFSSLVIKLCPPTVCVCAFGRLYVSVVSYNYHISYVVLLYKSGCIKIMSSSVYS